MEVNYGAGPEHVSHAGSQREAGERWGTWHGDPMGGSEEERKRRTG